jgi:hypothetical protein
VKKNLKKRTEVQRQNVDIPFTRVVFDKSY